MGHGRGPGAGGSVEGNGGMLGPCVGVRGRAGPPAYGAPKDPVGGCLARPRSLISRAPGPVLADCGCLLP